MISKADHHRRQVMALIRATPEWNEYHVAYSEWLDAHIAYVLQYDINGMIKIGYSSNVAQRIQHLQSAAPFPLRLLGWNFGGRRREQELHKRFTPARAWGEWFFPTAELMAFSKIELRHDSPPITGDAPDMTAKTRMQDELWERHGRFPAQTP